MRSNFPAAQKNKLGLGFFNAIAQKEKAIIRNKTTGNDTSIVTEPLANYNIIVIDQAFKEQVVCNIYEYQCNKRIV